MSMRNHQPSLLNRIARVLLCLVFIHALIGKLTGFAGPVTAVAAKGLPLAPLLLFLVPATLLFHADLIDAGERIQSLKNLSIVGGLLLVIDQDGQG
jgi:putative oxidoreductase